MNTNINNRRLHSRRGVAPIIATLLLVAIAVVGGAIVFAYSQNFFSSSQISGKPNIESLKVIGYDGRDIATGLSDHNGIAMALSAGAADNIKNTGEYVAAYLKNDSVQAVTLGEVRLGGTTYSYETAPPFGATNQVYKILLNSGAPDLFSPCDLSLNGPWKFHGSSNVLVRPVDFYAMDFKDDAWATIDVPSCWQMRGYSHPIYVNMMRSDAMCPWGRMDPPHIPHDRNQVGSYRRTFTLPKDWDGRGVLIHFEGVESAFYLYCNSAKVGFSKDSRTPAEFDITPHLLPGENQIAVEVYQYSDGSYLEDQDKWRLAGIFRDVYIQSVAEVRVRDFFLRGGLEDRRRKVDHMVELRAQLSLRPRGLDAL